jgi:hypothetical protein
VGEPGLVGRGCVVLGLLLAPPPPITIAAGFCLTVDIPKAGMPNLAMVGGVGLKVTWF